MVTIWLQSSGGSETLESLDYLDGLIYGLGVNIKKNAAGVNIPPVSTETDKTPKKGFHVTNESNLKKEGGQL